MEMKIAYGMLPPPLSKQLRTQKLPFDPKVIKRYEDIRKSIHTLIFGDMLTDKQKDSLYLKLHGKVARHVQQQLTRQLKKQAAVRSKAAE